jgi:hypothetical protein
MAFPTANIEIVQGGTYKQPYYLYTQDDVSDTTEVAVTANLVGCHAHMQIRSAPGGTVFLDVSDITGGIDIDTVNSIVTVDLTSTMTSLLTVPTASYDLWLEFPSGLTIMLSGGTVTVDLSITSPVDLT